MAFIRETIRRGNRVLACAPSNTAVDNLLERLIASDQRVVRIGHPARVKDVLRTHTLDALVEEHANMHIARKLLRKAESLFQKADRFTRAKPAPGAKQDMRREAKQLKFEARQLERQAIKDVLDAADVVCATTTIDDELLGDRRFDWVVVDEACQCTEPGCWIPLLRGERILLAGDHLQLPPTVISDEAAEQGYSRSMMERLIETHGSAITRQLVVQYRMHEEIMRFSSERFYSGSLVPDESVRRHTLADFAHVARTSLTERPTMFIDTAGADYDEELEPDGASRLNPAEGRLVLEKVGQLIEAGLPATDIAVIAPYAAQGALAAANTPAITRPGNRYRRWISGTREGSGRHFVGTLQSHRGNRLSGRHPPHERRAHPGPPQADRHRRQRDAGGPSVLRRAVGLFPVVRSMPTTPSGKKRTDEARRKSPVFRQFCLTNRRLRRREC